MTVVPDPAIDWNGVTGQIKDIPDFKQATVMGPAINYSKLGPTGTTGPTGAFPFAQGPTRALIADAAGTVTGQDAYGNPVAGLPLAAGYNPISISALISITGPTGGLSQVWGVW
jgi:hypothetical protein